MTNIIEEPNIFENVLNVQLPGSSKMLLGDYIIHIFFSIIITYAAVYTIKFLLTKFLEKTNLIEDKKGQTIESIVKNSIQYIAIFIVIVCAIQPFFDLKDILVAGGVLGIVIGFGAQSLISDIFTGFFLLFEKQFQKGDFVSVNGEKESGTVEEVGMRVVKIRQTNGKLMIVPNGQIKKVVNGNVESRRVVESVITSYRESPQKLKEMLEKLCEELNENCEEFLLKDENGENVEPFRYLGMSSLDGTNFGYKYTITATIIDTEYIKAVNETKQKMAQLMYDNNIKMPEQQMYYQTKAQKEQIKKHL